MSADPSPIPAFDAAPVRRAAGAPLIVLSGGDVDQHGRRIAQVAHRIRGDRAEYVVDFGGPAS
jgi:hypothetical protein